MNVDSNNESPQPDRNAMEFDQLFLTFIGCARAGDTQSAKQIGLQLFKANPARFIVLCESMHRRGEPVHTQLHADFTELQEKYEKLARESRRLVERSERSRRNLRMLLGASITSIAGIVASQLFLHSRERDDTPPSKPAARSRVTEEPSQPPKISFAEAESMAAVKTEQKIDPWWEREGDVDPFRGSYGVYGHRHATVWEVTENGIINHRNRGYGQVIEFEGAESADGNLVRLLRESTMVHPGDFVTITTGLGPHREEIIAVDISDGRGRRVTYGPQEELFIRDAVNAHLKGSGKHVVVGRFVADSGNPAHWEGTVVPLHQRTVSPSLIQTEDR